jgi:hypothetical protein
MSDPSPEHTPASARPFLREDVEAVFLHRPPRIKSREARGEALLESLGRAFGTLLRRRGHRDPHAALARTGGGANHWARDHLLRGLLLSGVHVEDHQVVDDDAVQGLKNAARDGQIALLCVVQDHPDGDGIQLDSFFLGEALSDAVEQALVQCIDEMRYFAEPGRLSIIEGA